MEKLKDQQRFIAGYFGGHALSNGLDILLSCAEKVKDNPQIVFVLVGDGMEKRNLIHMAKSEKLKNVRFLEPVAKVQIPDLLSYFDCIFIGVKDSVLYQYGINMNKMFDAVMFGKPVVLSMTIKMTPIEKYRYGYVTKAGEIPKIVKCIEKLSCMDSKHRTELGERGKKAVCEQFTYHALAKKFEKVWR